MIPRMDVFGLRDALIGDYSDYVRGFMRLRDRRISEHVEQDIAAGRLWPDPSIGLNPPFADYAAGLGECNSRQRTNWSERPLAYRTQQRIKCDQ